MMMSKALCAAALALALVCSVAPAASADDTKCANWVCDTDYGFWAKNAVENAQGECECLPYYTSGPCEVRAAPRKHRWGSAMSGFLRYPDMPFARRAGRGRAEIPTPTHTPARSFTRA
mmetsp:Transcript_13991/g.44448  ORF Transcript_13991/g.44448 Transcript_13991/m.44448 type:complete len:118 (-) Transcript_13991:80-433(-)